MCVSTCSQQSCPLVAGGIVGSGRGFNPAVIIRHLPNVLHPSQAKPSEQATKSRSVKFTAICFPVPLSFVISNHTKLTQDDPEQQQTGLD